jgi:hypothetical protein
MTVGEAGILVYIARSLGSTPKVHVEDSQSEGATSPRRHGGNEGRSQRNRALGAAYFEHASTALWCVGCLGGRR